jgi:hypothetical protein
LKERISSIGTTETGEFVMNFKSKQSLFDFISNHLLRQGKKSRDDISCLYRGPGGQKCAVGCVIPDELYSVAMERNSTVPLIVLSASNGYKLPWYIIRYRNFLEEFQAIHDGKKNFEWKELLIELGQRHKLDVSRVKRMKLRED